MKGKGRKELMYVVYGKVEFFLPYCHSLKEKRKVINSVVDRVRKRFNISISEVEYQDLWQRGALGFAAVAEGENKAFLLAKVVRETVEESSENLEVLVFESQIIPYHD